MEILKSEKDTDRIKQIESYMYGQNLLLLRSFPASLSLLS